MDDGSSAVGLDEGPHKEGNTGDGADDGLDGEQVADDVGWEVDEGELEEPVEEETQHLEGGDVAAEGVVDPCVEVVAEDGAEHQLDTVAADGGLDAEPDAGHHDSVDDGPERTPDAEGGSAGHGEGDVVRVTDSGGGGHEAAAEEVAEPHGDPHDPPREPGLHPRGGDLPRVDVERVCDPEEHKVVPVPLSAGLLDGPQVVVEEEELREREALRALDLERPQPAPHKQLFSLLAVVAVGARRAAGGGVCGAAVAHKRAVPRPRADLGHLCGGLVDAVALVGVAVAASLVEVAAGLVDGEVFLDVLHWTRLTYTESCTTETETETETETRSTSTNRMCADVQKWGWKKILVLCYPRQKRAGKRKSTSRTQPLPDTPTGHRPGAIYIHTYTYIPAKTPPGQPDHTLSDQSQRSLSPATPHR